MTISIEKLDSYIQILAEIEDRAKELKKK